MYRGKESKYSACAGWIDLEKISELEYDFIVVAGGHGVDFQPVCKMATDLGISMDSIVLDRTICIPGFSFSGLRALRKSKLSIFARDCWGGFMYHQFGLPFLSPFINMFFSDDMFYRFLQTPQQYLKEPLKFLRKNQRPGDPFQYPVFLLGDIELHMNHDKDIDTAASKWIRRVGRVNWDNILVEKICYDDKALDRFEKIPFQKKVGFTPMSTESNCGYFVDVTSKEMDMFFKSAGLKHCNTN